MAKPAKIKPPFAWLGPRTELITLIAVVMLGALFRFLSLNSIPPGLYYTPAEVGLQALRLLHGHWPSLGAAPNYALIWVILQALPVKIFGSTLLALRIWPALFGTLAVLTTWLWAKSWFGLRIAWLSALFMAVTPWAVTLTRDGSSIAIIPFLTTLTLWLATLSRRRTGRSNLWPGIGLAVTLIIDLLAGPFGWLIFVLTIGIGLTITIREHKLVPAVRARAVPFIVLALGTIGCAMLAVLSTATIKHLPSALGLTINPATLGANLGHVLLMFNVAGDQNYRHNLAGEPLLNAFVGIMLVAGVLAGISRLHERRYRLLFVAAIATLIPALISTIGVPNAAHAAALMAPIFVLSAIGVSYLLELWYTTFPINSAARASGQAAVIVLLGLTIFQGYTQYFRAWAASDEVYAAYNEAAVAIAHNLASSTYNGTHYVVTTPDQFPVISYLDAGKTPYAAIQPSAIATLPATPPAKDFLITAAARPAATKILQAKFPGHTLIPEYSIFNQAQIYYIYDTTP